MEFIDFQSKYPLLSKKMIGWATDRICLAPSYLESEARSQITLLQHRIDRLRLHSIYRNHQDVEEFSYLKHDLEEAKNRLNSAKSLQPTTPSITQSELAFSQVKEVLSALENPSAENFFKWNTVLSGREKFYLSHLVYTLSSGQIGNVWSFGSGEWGYLDASYQVLSEPQLQTFTTKAGELIGYISLNSYDCQCLNSQNVMFVDIDLDFDGSDKTLPWDRPDLGIDEILQNIERVSYDADLKFEVFKTKNGLRLLELTRLWEADSNLTGVVLESLGCDRLYQLLCKSQGTFRARLTPKPWRNGNTVCRYITSFGDEKRPNHPIAKKVKDIHSRCVGTGKLA